MHPHVGGSVLASALLTAALAACGSDDSMLAPDAAVDAAPVDEMVDVDSGTPSIEGTPVEEYVLQSCSTSVVMGISLQIAQEVDCLKPGQLVEFEETATVEFTGVVLPYVSQRAKDDMLAAVAAGNGTVLRINSAFRTVVQQYLLFQWGQRRRCNINIVSTPGNSNHESGRAIDVQNYNSWISRLEARSWQHYGPGDLVHFTHTVSPDIRGADVLAFQRLWNRNAPDDQISEDGDYGPATEARIKRAPAEGFGIGAVCDSARRIQWHYPKAWSDADLAHALTHGAGDTCSH